MIQSPRTTVWVSEAICSYQAQDAVRYFRESGYWLLSIEAEHVVAVEELPAHHQDSFDRIRVTQALVEPMRLMIHDPLGALYSDKIIKV
ncbi:MAG: PIN domain-containing protein [Acidithiobacillus ferrivorans]